MVAVLCIVHTIITVTVSMEMISIHKVYYDRNHPVCLCLINRNWNGIVIDAYNLLHHYYKHALCDDHSTCCIQNVLELNITGLNVIAKIDKSSLYLQISLHKYADYYICFNYLQYCCANKKIL